VPGSLPFFDWHRTGLAPDAATRSGNTQQMARVRPASGSGRRSTLATVVMTSLDSKSRAASRGLSDIKIRNLFIIPTILFLIVFNIFPLIYSLGYSFTDFRASTNAPATFVGLQNYRELLNDPFIWANFAITAKYVIVSVTGQVVVGFGTAMLLNREIPFKGFITTLLLLPMMLSMAVVGLFWKLLYDPSFGIINYALGLGSFEWLANPEMALYAVAITDIWMWSPFVMLLSLAGLSAVPRHLYEAAAIDRAGPFYTFFRITLPLVAPILMIAIIFRTMEAFKTFDLAYILTSQPTTEVISIRLYKMAFQEWQTGRSCALAYIVLIMVLAITNIYVKYLNRVKER
jgi:multiple sugar transport system permease protein